jgi:all-trans-8'-apo-beta-carotenal 15,15'-oxygenase
VRYDHPFDGDGPIVRFAFADGRVHDANRLVRAAGFVAEEAAIRMLHRGFGTNLPGGLRANLLRMPIKNTADTGFLAQTAKASARAPEAWPTGHWLMPPR